jgi:putative phage-type endonuclease
MTPEQRAAWLAERRTGIGGSDAAAAVGLSKWKTPLELYMDKRGELETAENEPMRWGNLLEPVVRQEYCNRTGRTVIVPPGIIRHPKVGFALMTPDGIADESRVLQVKTARTSDGWGEPGSSEIPQEYLFQTQHEMFVTGLPVADVAVLIGGSDFRIYVVEADAEFQTLLIDQEAEFWKRVITEQPPGPVNREDVKRRWKVSTGAKVVSSPDIREAAAELMQLKGIAAQIDEAIEERTANLQAYMADAAELAAPNGDVIATWKNIKANPRFDAERFKTEQPELWKQYLREPQPSRRFLLKAPKGQSICQQPLPPLPAIPMATAIPQLS